MPTATPKTPRARATPAKAPAKATAKAPAVARPAPALAARKARRGTALPGWSDLDDAGQGGVARHGGRAAAGSRKATQIAARKAAVRPLDAVPSLRFGLLVLIACVVGTVFVSHVYATRATLADLQDARRENDHLRLAGQRLRGEFDQMTGPDAVMPRALALGLEEGIAYGVPIHLP